jgi:hypothetical protein
MVLEHLPDFVEDRGAPLIGQVCWVQLVSLVEHGGRLRSKRRARNTAAEAGTPKTVRNIACQMKEQVDDSGDEVFDGVSLLHGTKTTSLDEEAFGGGGRS